MKYKFYYYYYYLFGFTFWKTCNINVESSSCFEGYEIVYYIKSINGVFKNYLYTGNRCCSKIMQSPHNLLVGFEDTMHHTKYEIKSIFVEEFCPQFLG